MVDSREKHVSFAVGLDGETMRIALASAGVDA